MTQEIIQTANEWVPVVNNLIKIVIPSLTTGVIALKIAKYNANKDMKVVELNQNKDIRIAIFENKSRKTEEIAEMAEEYFYAADQYISHPLGNILGNTNKLVLPPAIEPTRFEILNNALLENHKNRNKALSKIKMLGISKAELAITKHDDTLREFHFKVKDLCSIEGEKITLDQAQSFKNRAQEASVQFYIALSEYNEKLKN